ncbi:3-carboxy-cis,cis-muconate cycloisomerase [Cyphellophora europaea CBS 101466]|uniref:3-carboxy-cis,cis-muconate cycloisomerase n=1 Tax=Cyphellophora europaea (strain CBS 101466) TaxID=1220924 RepID=W2S3V3_CYPE1|nr:3-carboxy-cis,cis-muconate cycloisomerase [Cyphellophora europaea CBS 101466]ETN42639.1 3-carboxy-cis,cis-muconate cycloisomerase [Cyphellophora europaea CBS 101466]
MSSVQDSIIFGNILSTPESAEIWSDHTRTQYYLQFEAELATAQAQLGIIPASAAKLIVKHCDVKYIDFAELKKETELVGYPVLGVVKQLVKKVNDVEAGTGEWAHWGATTQDVTDTATVLQLRDTLELIEVSLAKAISALKSLASKHKATPMPARSNLQQAVPTSFGFKLARLLATLLRHRQRLETLRTTLLTLEFSGAAGTLATLPPTTSSPALGLDCQALLASNLKLKSPLIAWHTERDTIAEYGAFCALLTSTCAKFALDVKLMMQTEVGEVSEPYVPHRGSSSTMPQKRNPISCAYVTAMNATVRQLSASLYEAMVEDHERSTGPWEIEWIVLPQISTLTHATIVKTEELVRGLEVHEDAMRKNLDITQGAIVSEAVMMGLAKKLGRQYAHDLVYKVCQQAAEQHRPIIELLWKDEEVKKTVSREELKGLCDPANYLGYSETMVDRVLETC